MKKTLMSLAALMMLMTAPVMTSCSNDLDETVPAEEQGNVVTLTIAPPTAEAETRVAMNDQLQITGWEVGDKVNLYRVNWEQDRIEYSGDEFTCIDASTGTFSGTLESGQALEDYSLAVYGATASEIDGYIALTPTTYSSDKLKDVVVMVAKKSDEGTYQMKIANNVLKVTNTGSDVEVAWTGKDISGTDVDFFKPLITYNSGRWKGYDLDVLPDGCKEWNYVPHFTLAGSNKVTYLTMSQASYNSTSNCSECWGLAKQDGTEVLAKKSMTGKGYDYDTETGVTGKVWTVTVGQAAAATDANLLAGVFSVSANKKVQFTKGNLQATYNGSTYTWGFAANQYDYVGNAEGNTSITSDGKNTDGKVVDLFGWSTDATNNNWGIHTKTENTDGYTTGNFKDWGENFLGKNYSTLSKDEWTYLLNPSNETSGARTQTNRYAMAMVNNVKGLLIFPDNYNGTTTVTGIDGIAAVNKNVTFPTASIPTETWQTMESAGVVFLPAAGSRNGSSVSVDFGSYWYSTAYGTNEAYYMSFCSEGNGFKYDDYRYYGLSVRLVSVASE